MGRCGQARRGRVEGEDQIVGEEHPDTLTAMANLGISYMRDRLDDSIGLLEKSHEAMRKILGNEHPDTLWALGWVAESYQKDGRFDESMTLYETVLDGRKRVLGEDHPDTLIIRNLLESSRNRREDNVTNP